MIDSPVDGGLKYSLLDEPLIRYRKVVDGAVVAATLPQLFVALGGDEVRDYPALRPHQRHPWHAFLVQLAAIALHAAGRDTPFGTADEWRSALLSLTPNDADGAAWCLVSPPNRPAVLQAPVPNGRIDEWKNRLDAADELDMLVTSKNHDVKAARASIAQPDDWLFALLSLQTQEGFLGAGNYGVSRMNGGFASRSGVGVSNALGHVGQRWRRDIALLIKNRARVVEERGLKQSGGIALIWTVPWDGLSSLAFSALDPFYIDLCRRIRLLTWTGRLLAMATGSKAARVAAKELNGVTGDAWSPIETDAAKALTISADGFHYKLVAELLFGAKYTPPIAQDLTSSSSDERYVFVAQGVTRGQGKTEGYHERRVPISMKVRGLLLSQRRDVLSMASSQRIALINEVRSTLWSALAVLFNNGVSSQEDSIKNKASNFSRPFEKGEDARFFLDLSEEIESEDPVRQRLIWQIGLVDRAEAILRGAFENGPRSGMQRYRAQASALSRFHGALRGPKSPLPDLAHYYREQANALKENSHDHA